MKHTELSILTTEPSYGFAHVIVSVCDTIEENGELRPVWPANRGFDGLGAQGIVWTAQLDNERDGSYGWRMGPSGTSDTHPHTFAEIERMTKHMRKFNRAYEAAVQQLGPPQTFGQFVAWHLTSTKIGRVWSRGHDGAWFESQVPDIAYRINGKVAALNRRLMPRAG